MAYAAKTTVAVSTTRLDIEKRLRLSKAHRIITMDEPLEAVVGFELADRVFKIAVAIPGEAREQTRRSLWRALLLTIRAKLEAVEQGISTTEEEFLAFLVLPDGRTAGEWLRPQIEISYAGGQMPPLLPAPKGST